MAGGGPSAWPGPLVGVRAWPGPKPGGRGPTRKTAGFVPTMLSGYGGTDGLLHQNGPGLGAPRCKQQKTL